MSGASVNLEDYGEGEWKVTQTGFDGWEQSHDDVQEISWSFGPIKNEGEVDSDTLDIKLNPSYCGIAVGTIEGNLKDGLKINIHLDVVRGSQRWYLKNGNEVWTRTDIKITFNGSYEMDRKILVL
ncbi:hypothetical protein IL306_014973 [Fusarium sp. DS 682]|nr:hypothetical protein IL306_014973 [Fusarium sp. DS 682]